MTVRAQRKGYISRRDFLKVCTVTLAGVGLAACQPANQMSAGIPTTPIPVPNQYPDIPFAPPKPPPYILQVLTSAEARAVEALTARLYPGDVNDPGAREAGVTNFIDKKLAFHDGYVKYTYLQAPHAKTYEGDQPPDQKSDELGEIVWVKKSEIERYGYQSLLKPVDRYRAGIAAMDRFANEKYGSNFVDLSEDQQDELIDALEKGNAPDYFKDPTGKQFFDMLQDDTVQGMFADPAYGGNRDMIGWKQIGYPGAQRAYTPVDMDTEGPVRPPQSLAMLHRFHSGMGANPGVIIPPSGSEFTPNP
jgi:gluconate 2-dehydrogenase gamma chain